MTPSPISMLRNL